MYFNYVSDIQQVTVSFRDNLELISNVEYYYKNCLNGTAQKVIASIVDGFQFETEKYCQEPKSHHTFVIMDIAKCLNKNEIFSENCVEKIVENFVKIKFVLQEQKLPQTCW